MIYFIRNFNLVLPYRFLVNILQYFVSSSKTVSALYGRVTPEASYSTYKKWVNANGKKALKRPKDDQVTFFDNIGKYVLKNYSMSSQKNVRPDIVTTTLQISLGEKNLETKSEFKPFKKLVNEQTLLLTDNKIEASNINFRRYQLNYIKENVQSKNDVINKKL